MERYEEDPLVREPLVLMGPRRLTMDCEGSVLSTGGVSERTAVGFNKKKKGQRSYYPLFCTIAQTEQVLDLYHRPGNVHDSNGAEQFILNRIGVIVTNKRSSARNVLRFHNGRGAQENIFGELKSQLQMDYVPVRRLAGNQLYLMSAVLSHNLLRRLQIETAPAQNRTTEKRSPLWEF